MRTASVFAVVLVLSLTACGQSTLSLDEYVEQMQTRADDLEARGEHFYGDLFPFFDLETGTVVDADALQRFLDPVAAAWESYFHELGILDPPREVEDAHDAFVAVAALRLERWRDTTDQANEIQTRAEVVVLVFKSREFIETCEALERAVSDNGSELDLDCD